MKRILTAGLLAAALAMPVTAHAQAELPLEHAGAPTTAAITAADLMTRLYEFADDSMMGRQAGTPYNVKGAEYIARHLKALGLQPAGENGTYFQSVPLVLPKMLASSSLTVAGRTFRGGEDFVALKPDSAYPLDNVAVIFGGTAVDTTNLLDADVVRGKIVVLLPLKQPIANPQALIASNGYQAYLQSLAGAAGLALVRGDSLTPNDVRAAMEPAPNQVRLHDANAAPSATTLILTTALADQLFGAPIATVAKGTIGGTVNAVLQYVSLSTPGRNVIAVLPGSDAKLKSEYIGIGAHNDHVGYNNIAQDHDSLRAFNTVARTGGVEDPRREPTEAEWARIHALTDSLHALHGGVRRDSIFNGADDDGSGSMAVLEIAEAFARSAHKTKRSLLFVWHTGEELGMFGSQYFMEHPTVARDSIVADLNIDMIGRGGAQDVPNGGPAYLQLIGSRRLSTEYGDLVEQVNRDTNAGFVFDYQYDADNDPHQFYCRSDHWQYGRFGIPVTFFSTGGHRDYHMRTDEPQYIDYQKYARVTQFIHDVAQRVADLDHRVSLDKPRPDPDAPCRQ